MIDYLKILHLTSIAIANGATITNQNDLIEFLKTVDKNLLATAHVDEIGLSNRFWVPCIERKLIHTVTHIVIDKKNIIFFSAPNTVDPFFLRSPDVILADNFNTDVETMFGFASHVKHRSEILLNLLLINKPLYIGGLFLRRSRIQKSSAASTVECVVRNVTSDASVQSQSRFLIKRKTDSHCKV